MIENVPLERLRMRGNARTNFDAMQLEELVSSMRDFGGAMQLPVGYRAEDGFVELICGERRMRAQTLLREREGARWASMPVRLIEEPTEADFRKWSLAENLQRVDLKPSEIGGWLQSMLELEDPTTGRALWTQASLAEEIGKQPRWVTSVLAANRAPAEVVRAVDEGRCSVEVAGLVGSLPAAVQEDAAREVVLGPMGPMAREAARSWVAERYRRDLRAADFDPRLDYGPEMGPCRLCEWWGGNREDVAGVQRSQTCLNPACFGRKQRTHAEMAARDGGVEVRWLSSEEAEGIFEGYSGSLAPGCGYVDLGAKPEAGLLVDGTLNRDSVPTWRKVLAEEGLASVSVLDDRGRRRDLVEADAAIRAGVAGRYGSLFRPDAGKGLLSAEEKAAKRAVDSAVEREGRSVAVEGAREWLRKFASGTVDGSRLLPLLEVALERLCKPDDVAFLGEVLEPGVCSAKGAQVMELAGMKQDVDGLTGLLALAMLVRGIRYEGFEGMIEDGPLGDLCERIGFDPAQWHRSWKRRRAAAERSAREEAARKQEERAKAEMEGRGR